MAQTLSMNAWFTVSIGFLAGGSFLFAGDLLYEKLISKNQYKSLEKRCAMLVLSITIHNIPEGLAVGVAFGALAHHGDRTALISACMLALEIGLQNFPEGTAVSIPMLRDGYSMHQAFFMGQLSGLVEPISGVIGSMAVQRMQMIMPVMLSFAAGAMIYVVFQELIPESQRNEKHRMITLCTMMGFAVMMILDVAL